MSASKPHSEHYFGGPFEWKDLKSDSRMQFASFEEMQSFLAWKSGRLQEQLESVQGERDMLVLTIEGYQRGLRRIADWAEDELLQGPPELGLILGEARILLDGSNPAKRPT